MKMTCADVVQLGAGEEDLEAVSELGKRSRKLHLVSKHSGDPHLNQNLASAGLVLIPLARNKSNHMHDHQWRYKLGSDSGMRHTGYTSASIDSHHQAFRTDHYLTVLRDTRRVLQCFDLLTGLNTN